MKTIKIILWAILALLMPTLLMAQEVGGGTLVANDYLDTIIKVMGIIVVAVCGFAGKAIRARAIKMGIDEEIVDSLENRVTTIYRTSYAKLKEIGKDKKITKEEARELRNEAFALTKSELSGKAYDLVKSKGLPYASKIIENIISNFKARKSGDKKKK